MTKLVTPEEERKNFEEYFASFLKCPHSEEPIEENVPELSASPKKENADKQLYECLMPEPLAQKLQNKRKFREKRYDHRKHLVGIKKRRRSDAREKRIAYQMGKQDNSVTAMPKQKLNAVVYPQLDGHALPMIEQPPMNNVLQTAFDELQTDGFTLKEIKRHLKRTAWFLRITPQGVIFFFLKKLQKINEKLIFEVYNV